MSTIWRKSDSEWQQLKPSGFPTEASLHDLVQEAPGMLPLSGDPAITVLGREVPLGTGYADLLGVETDGRLVVVEIKLSKNSEAKRAVVAQVLTYAAYLRRMSVDQVEQVLAGNLAEAGHRSIAAQVRAGDESGDYDESIFEAGLADSLETGSFRLVLVLDEAPPELVQLVGYLESVTHGITIDLVTVSMYRAGSEEVLVPQRVDPEYQPDPAPTRSSRAKQPQSKSGTKGSDAFEQSIGQAVEVDRPRLRALLEWARQLEADGLVDLSTVIGDGRTVLRIWVPGEKGGLVAIWNDQGAYISLFRSMFVRRAWDQISPVEAIIGGKIGQGNTIQNPPDELLAALRAAYQDASQEVPGWNGRDYYVSFGENEQRNWDEARKFGFVSAGGGAWYTNTLKALLPGNRVFVYIPRGRGVGGYVGVGEVTGEARPASEFEVEIDGVRTSYLEVTESEGASQYLGDPDNCEWVVPVRWIVDLPARKPSGIRISSRTRTRRFASRTVSRWSH